MSSPSPDESRIDLALEGRLSPEEWEAFQLEVTRDAGLRSAYVDRAWLHASLKADRDTVGRLLEPAALEAPARPRLAAAAWAAAAACVTLGLSLAFLRSSPPEEIPAVAILAQASDCKWAGSELPTAEQSRLGPGILALVEGIATLAFESGATITLEAPTTLEIVDAMTCRLLEGTVTADVPESAHGFVIETADLTVIDLGTRFGVTAGSAGNSQVFVFEGEVQVDGREDGKSRRLTEGKAFHVGSGHVPMGTEEPSHFPPAPEAGGWTAIPTSFGRGKDAYVRRGDAQGATGAHPLLMVKHSDLPGGRNNERRAYLTFDLSAVDLDQVSEAQLVLDPEPSGFGFSSMVPDSRFAVWGITDETLDHWEEDSLRWSGAPAGGEEGVDDSRAVRLAEFWIPRGGSGDPFPVRGSALADFVRGSSNGLATFLIVRETGETHTSGLVHAFASKEHPSARPPALRLR